MARMFPLCYLDDPGAIFPDTGVTVREIWVDDLGAYSRTDSWNFARPVLDDDNLQVSQAGLADATNRTWLLVVASKTTISEPAGWTTVNASAGVIDDSYKLYVFEATDADTARSVDLEPYLGSGPDVVDAVYPGGVGVPPEFRVAVGYLIQVDPPAGATRSSDGTITRSLSVTNTSGDYGLFIASARGDFSWLDPGNCHVGIASYNPLLIAEGVASTTAAAPQADTVSDVDDCLLLRWSGVDPDPAIADKVDLIYTTPDPGYEWAVTIESVAPIQGPQSNLAVIIDQLPSLDTSTVEVSLDGVTWGPWTIPLGVPRDLAPIRYNMGARVLYQGESVEGQTIYARGTEVPPMAEFSDRVSVVVVNDCLGATVFDAIFGEDPDPPDGDDIVGIGLQLFLKDEADERAWVDITDLGVLARPGISCSRTSTQQGAAYRQEAGRIVFELDNLDGQWDPLNDASPWQIDGRTLLVKGLPIRLFITPPGESTGTLVWSGRVTAWDVAYSRNYGIVRVAGVDAVDRLRAADLPELQVAEGAGESGADRVDRILDRIDWPDRDLDSTPGAVLQATTLARNAWEEILLTGDSDGAWPWVGRDGTVRYLHRDWFLDGDVVKDPTVVFSMLPDDLDGGAVEFVAADPTNDSSQLYNVVKLARVGGREQAAVADDAVADDETGFRATARSDLVTGSDLDVMRLALRTVGLTRVADYRWRTVEVHLFPFLADAELWVAMLALDFADLARMRWATPETPTVESRTIERDHVIVGVTWVLVPRESVYRVTFQLAQAPRDLPPVTSDETGNFGPLPLTMGWR